MTVDAAPPRVARMLTDLLDHAHRHATQTIRIDLHRTGDSAQLPDGAPQLVGAPLRGADLIEAGQRLQFGVGVLYQ